MTCFQAGTEGAKAEDPSTVYNFDDNEVEKKVEIQSWNEPRVELEGQINLGLVPAL